MTAELLNIIHQVFDQTLGQSYQTRLQGGAAEPLYQPGNLDQGESHCIYFRADFPASALHEISHWCQAGAARRQLVDFGYWYAADGRSSDQQHLFESAEVIPQAMEWLFAVAVGCDFHVSFDNLSGECSDGQAFRVKVREAALRFYREGLPPRAQLFCEALRQATGREQLFHRYWQDIERLHILPH